MAFRIWRDDFLDIQLLFFILLLLFLVRAEKAGGFCIMYTKTARSLATIAPHDRFFFSLDTTRC